jgi:hypothetical protein
MEEQGINAAALFKEAGLVEEEQSTGIKDASRVRIDPRHSDEQPGPVGQSTLSSGRRSSRVSGSGSSTSRSMGGGSNGNLQPVMEISSESNETAAPENKPAAIEISSESNETAAPENKPSAVEPTLGS